MTKRFEFNCLLVAGVKHHYYGTSEHLMLLEYDQPLVLVREPDNEFDANAIRVEDKSGNKLGYIPRVLAQAYSRMMDNGYDLDAVVDDVNESVPDIRISLRLPSLNNRK